MADSYSVSLKSKSIFDIVYEADIVVQLVVLVLLFASVWSWSIILNKLFLFSTINKKDKNFARNFNSKSNFGEIFESVKNNVLTPIEYIFVAVINEMKNLHSGEAHQSEEHHKSIKEKLELTMLHQKNKHIAKLEDNLGNLATIASASTFIGLLGTVWGIMRSFQDIAISKNTSLAVVAPGIAEALFATALGLIAAIPALLFYNILLGKVSYVEGQTDDFMMEFNNKIDTVLKL